MKKIKILGVIIIFFLLIGFVFIKFKLKYILADKLTESLARPVYIGDIGIRLPLWIYLKNIIIYDYSRDRKELEEFLRIKELRFFPALIPLLKKKIFLYSITVDEPQLNLIRWGEDNFNFSQILKEKKKKGEALSLLFLKFKINNGKINFIDKIKNTEISFTDINLSLHNFVLPFTDVTTVYEINAKLCSSLLNSSGWVNFFRKDMEAKFKLDKLDIYYLKPYLEKIVFKIKQGFLSAYGDIFSKNNLLTLKCKLELEKITAENDSSQIFGIPLEKLIQVFKDKDEKIAFEFAIETKFDQPSIDYAKIGSILWKNITEKLAGKASQLILENIGEKTKEFISDKLKIKE